MNRELLTVKELAAELRLSVKSIQRAYRKGHIPVKWICRTAFFDLRKVHEVMEENGKTRMASFKAGDNGATGGDSRRSAAKSPRSVRRGRIFQPSPRRNAPLHGFSAIGQIAANDDRSAICQPKDGHVDRRRAVMGSSWTLS